MTTGLVGRALSAKEVKRKSQKLSHFLEMVEKNMEVCPYTLRHMVTLPSFSAMFSKGDSFLDFLLAYLQAKSSQIGVNI